MKSLGRANDSIPEDEALLAEACAAAKDAGLAWTQGCPFRDREGTWTEDRAEAVSCCALGALDIAGAVDLGDDPTPSRRSHLEYVHAGNDRPFGWTHRATDRGESLGWAFRCFMTQDESDPATEVLIKERSK